MRIIIARPTAASAAATTITKKTNTCPCSWPSKRLKETKARLTALSISSMDMKMVRMLRLKINAITPNPNKTALSTRKYEVGTTTPPECFVDLCSARLQAGTLNSSKCSSAAADERYTIPAEETR